jgi:hypothetical protein
MRLVKFTVPKGRGKDVARIAFDCGISAVSVHDVEQLKAGAEPKSKEAVDMKASTAQCRAVVEAVVRAPFYDRHECAMDIREPRSFLNDMHTREITYPLAAPAVDIEQELWQFSQVTYSFVLRVFVAAVLLSYGMVSDNPLLMVGGLAFLPIMPLVLGMSLGTLARQWKLVAQSVAAFMTGALVIIVAGVAVAAFTQPPLAFTQFPPMGAGIVFSFGVGLAAALATADDAGHRQLVGLAAASQLALVPAWLGISLVYGFTDSPAEKLTGFGLNTLALAIGAGIVYAAFVLRAAQYKPGADRKAGSAA